MRYRSWAVVAGSSWSRIVLHRCLLVTPALLLAASPTLADAHETVVRIEEDWQLVVSDPEPTTNGPQVMTIFSPAGDVENEHCQFLINHRTLPDFTAGGLQLQIWDGDQPVGSRNFPYHDQLDDENETVTWTQSVRLGEGNLTFEIKNGNSSTWGSFGGQGYLRDSVSTSISTLHGYDPNVSADQSGVTFAANRVTRLVLKEVRWYSESGLVGRDTTERVVHQQ